MYARTLKLVFLVITLFFLSIHPSSAQCDRERDSMVLISIYNSNPDFQDMVNWGNRTLTLSEWNNIKFNGEGCVNVIDIRNSLGIEVLPDSIGLLNNLDTLRINFNEISILPESIDGLESLRCIELRGNKLNRLPESIGNLNSIRTLDVSYNSILELPPSILNLNSLRTLDLRNNLLAELPESFGSLRFLQSLYLRNNSLMSIPESIGDIRGLFILDLSNNNLNELPESIGKIDLLLDLELPGNGLLALPSSILELQNLQRLNLNKNRITELPLEIGQLINLQELFARQNELEEIPSSIGDLRNMITLDISYNDIKELPDEIGDMVKLERLDLEGNKIQSIPTSIGRLSNLITLNISRNRFTFEDFYQIDNLLPSLSVFTYYPQRKFYVDTILYYHLGDFAEINLEIDESVINNEYFWFKEGISFQPIPYNINSNSISFSDITLDDVGFYSSRVTNPDYKLETLESFPFGIRVCNRTNDSLELVRLYNNTNGFSWGISSGWLSSSPIDQWYGVSTDGMGCVNKIDLSNNDLEGVLPDLQLNTLDTLILSGNNLSGEIPNNMFIPYVKYVDLASNIFSGSIPDVVGSWMLITNLILSNNNLSESIPPDIGDLCELEELELDGNGFEGELPVELTMLFNLKKNQVSFADNQIVDLRDEFIYFCPFGEAIMRNNPMGGFQRFVEICGDTCSGVEFDQLANYPWVIDTLQVLDCIGNGCFENNVRSDAGYVLVRDVELFYTRTRCYTTSPNEYIETVKLYDCGAYLLESVTCTNGLNCLGLSVLTVEEFEELYYDSRWSCSCNITNCIPIDTIVIDAGEIDTLETSEFLTVSDFCNYNYYSISSVNNELPGDPPYVTEDNIGFTYELLTENLVSGQQCTTTIEVVRGATGRNEYEKPDLDAPVMIACHPNPLVDFLRCPEIDMVNVEEYKVFNIQGMEMPKHVQDHQNKLQLNVRDYPSGMYILLVKTKDRQYLNRFTVIR